MLDFRLISKYDILVRGQ